MELLKHLDGQEQAFVNQEQSAKQAEMQQQQSLMQSSASETAPTNAEQQSSGLSDEDETALVDMLVQLGFNDDDIQQGVVMAASGMDPQTIIEQLGAKYQGVPQ